MMRENLTLKTALPSILLILVCLAGLAVLSQVATGPQPHALDQQILLSLRTPGNLSDPLGSPSFEGKVRDITALGGVAVLTLFTTLGVLSLWIAGRWRIGLFALATIGGGQIVSSLAKLLVDRQRPDVVPHMMVETSLSFPSGHAMMSAVVYLTLAALLARLTPLKPLKAFLWGSGVLVAVLVGLSRLYIGVHWPSDVLAGWCLGVAWVTLCLLVGRSFLPAAR